MHTPHYRFTQQQERALAGLGGLVRVVAFLFLLAFFCWLSTGCRQQSTFVPQPQAVDQDDAGIVMDALKWTQSSPNRGWAYVAPTGSMSPVITERSVLLFVKYTGQKLRNGAVVVFDRTDAPNCVHVVCDQTATDVYMSGWNNRLSDGWFSKDKIKGIVVGQLYRPVLFP